MDDVPGFSGDPRFVLFDSLALDAPSWRVVRNDPPTVEDFRSYAELGRNTPRVPYLRLFGVSMWPTREKAAWANGEYRLRGVGYAEVDVARDSRILVCPTDPGGSDHLEVFAPSDVLFGFVVNFVPDGGH